MTESYRQVFARHQHQLGPGATRAQRTQATRNAAAEWNRSHSHTSPAGPVDHIRNPERQTKELLIFAAVAYVGYTLWKNGSLAGILGTQAPAVAAPTSTTGL